MIHALINMLLHNGIYQVLHHHFVARVLQYAMGLVVHVMKNKLQLIGPLPEV